nr:GNAT family N-acetyltransferase [Micromonospora sp. DSM 115978]
MLIRSFIPHDLAQLTELTIATFGPFYENHFRPTVGDVIFTNQHRDWRADYRTLVPQLHDPEQHKYVDVAEVDHDLAGYIAWAVDPTRRNGTVTIVAVTARHRRHGVGTALCEHAFNRMRDHGTEVVEIGTGGDPFHAPARRMYERLGCTPFPTTYYYRQL